MRVLFVTNRYTPIGGAEKDLAIHLDALAKHGHEGHVATCEQVPAQESIHYLPPHMGFRDALEGARRVIDLARQIDADLIHLSNLTDFLGSRAIAPIAAALPTVWTIQDVRPICHSGQRVDPATGKLCYRRQGIRCIGRGCRGAIPRSDLQQRARAWGNAFIASRTMRQLAGVLVYSAHSGRLLEAHGVDSERIHVLPEQCLVPGRLAPPATAPAPPTEPTTVLSVGRLDDTKGQADMVRIAEALAHTDTRFDIVGDGPLLPAMQAAIRDKQLADRVRLLGRLDDRALGQRLEAVGMVAIPSRVMETFGRIGVEANMAGRPAVTFDNGGCHEWLTDGSNGRIVPFRDLQAMARAIAELAREPDRAYRMGLAGWERQRHRYTAEVMYEGLISAYEAAINQKRREFGKPVNSMVATTR